MRKKTLTLLMVAAFVGAALSLAQADVIQLETSITAKSPIDSELRPPRIHISRGVTTLVSNGDAAFCQFDKGCGDVGLPVESGPFTAGVSGYDGTTLLRTVTENGVANHNANGGASFISGRGLSANDAANAAFSVAGFNNALINALHLSTIPEPASLFLIGAGLLGIAGISRLKFIRK